MMTEFHFIHTVLAFLFALCVLIAFHELGHYLVARLCNVKVLRFSLGIGKVIYSRRFGRDQTEWAISAIPLGGYVKMLDLREQEQGSISPEDLKREFTHQSVWKRIAIVVAGPAANFLLAIILFSVLFMVGVAEPIAKLRTPDETTQAYHAGLRGNEVVTAVNGKPIELWSELRWELLQLALDRQPAILTIVSAPNNHPHQITLSFDQLSPDDLQGDFLNKLGLNLALSKAELGKVNSDGAAARAGLQKGDIVTRIDGKRILDNVDFVDIVRTSPNKPLHFSVDRSGVIHEFLVMPDAVTVDGKLVGRLNVEVRSVSEIEMRVHRDSFLASIQKASERTWSSSILILKTLAKMVVGDVSIKNITGPLTIADYAGQSANIGWISYLSFIAFISISLGVMNLLPIPILDGGHLMYYALEVIIGRPVPPNYWEMGQRAGVAMLLLLMAVAFYNDIVRLLS